MAVKALVATLLLMGCCCCPCTTFNNCTARPVSNDLPPPTYDISINATSVGQGNFSGIDFSADPQTQGFNLSDTDDLDGLSHARRMDFLRERKKHQRIITIRSQILERLGINETPNTTSHQLTGDNRRRAEEAIKRLMQTQNQRQDTDDIFAESVQSFYPSCSLPRNTDRDMWENLGSFHVYFTIPIPRLAPGTSLTISSAKLRLFKLYDGQATEPPPTVTTVGHPDNETEVNVQCDERFRITVFQYTRPLKKTKKGKRYRKLIDSRMIPADFAGWVEFDVRSSIRDWIDNINKNLGFEIVLEDSLSSTHNPSEFFQNMNCSEVNEPPFPRFMEDNLNRLSDNDSLGFNNETFPTLDLRMVKLLDDSTMTTVQNEVPPSTQRRKRDSRVNCHKSCCMAQTYVRMEDIGMDNIIAPSGFTTGVCIGGCDVEISTDTYGCVATQKAPLFVMELTEESNIRSRNISNLVTTACGCRRISTP